MPIKRHFLFSFISACLFFVSLFLCPSPLKAESDPYLLNLEDSEYLLSSADIPPENFSLQKWTPFGEFNFQSLRNSTLLYVKLKLPSGEFDFPSLCLKIFVPDLEIYCNSQKIYQKEASDSNYLNLILPLPSEAVRHTSCDIIFKIRYGTALNLGESYHLFYGDMKELIHLACQDQMNDFYSSFQQISMATLFLFLSLAALFVYFFQKRQHVAFLSFGLFSLSLGIKYSCDPLILSFLNIAPRPLFYMDNISFLLVPAFLFKFVENIFFTQFHPVIRRLWQAHLLAVLCFLILFTEEHYMNAAPHLIIFFLFVNTLVCWVVIFRTRAAVHPKIRSFFLCFLTFFILMIVNQILVQEGILEDFPEVDFFGIAALLFTFALGYIMIDHYNLARQKIHDSLLEIEKNKNDILRLEKSNIKAELEVLKNQVNPHFLFNTFNTLAGLIETRSENAAEFVQCLSRMYRYVLQSRMNELVTLEEEMEFVRSYLFILSKRFGDNLKPLLSIPQELLSLRLPPLSLQILVENAVKHNVISAKYPLTLHIQGVGRGLCVKNTLQKKELSEPSTGMGLDNIQKRYQFFTDTPVVIEKNSEFFSVTLPLIEGNKRDYENSDHRR